MQINLKIPIKQGKTRPDKGRDALWGSGLDAKAAQKAEKDAIKVAEAESHTQVIPEQSTIAAAMDLALPTTLMTDDIQLDPAQQEALDGLLRHQFGCLIGAAGTGKTTTIKALLQAILKRDANPSIKFVAFTGRAVQQIKRALPAEFHMHCDTIHGMLEFAPEIEERYDDKKNEVYMIRIFKPQRTATNQLDTKYIFIDEGGMVPIPLWNNIMEAARDGTRIYVIGDINQLPPVQGRSVLGFAMIKWPTYELNRVHRTEESAIIDGAWRILNGRMPEKVTGKIVMLKVSDNSIEAFQQTVGILQRLDKNGTFNRLRDALIVPQNSGNIGQEHLNEYLCPYFNPSQKVEGITINPRTIITAGGNHVSFAVGDKVMVTKNDRPAGLTNGMIGVIESIIPNEKFHGESIGDMAQSQLADNFSLDMAEIEDALIEIESDKELQTVVEEERERQSSHIMTIKFQNRDTPNEFSTAGGINTLQHAYAFTCHKSQGGEYPVVVILLHSCNFRVISREWLYTAWTRAQEKVILLYNSKGLQMALRNQRIKGNTLAEKAESFNKLQKSGTHNGKEVRLPILPDAVEI